jgi:hypothetical protein
MNRKGGAMVEAALVFPIIMLSLIAIISILTFLFEEAVSQYELHLVIRSESGLENGTFHGKGGSSNIAVYKGIKGIHSVMNGKTSVDYEYANIFTRKLHKQITAYQHLTDEQKYVRYIDFFVREEKKDEEHVEKAIQ